MTPWHRNEYILKGAFLGLWVFVALQVAVDRDAVRVDLPWVLGWVAAGLAVGLTAATAVQLRRGLRPSQNWAAFPLLVLLESPKFVYGGIVFGLAAGVLSGREFAEPVSGPIAGWFGLTFQDIRHVTTSALPGDDPGKGNKPGDWLLFCLLGGVLLGLGLYRFRQVDDPRWRFGMGIGVAALMVYLAREYVARLPGFDDQAARFNLGVYILLGLPFFYLLTFCGEAEESEAEIMTVCAALGIALYLMGMGVGTGATVAIGPAVPFLLPMTIYFVYATRVLPGLRVFKHTLRGYSYLNIGRLREALYYFRRALVWGPNNALARQGMLRLHHSLTLPLLDRDPELIEALDFELCLDRAAGLIIRPDRAPTADERGEATRFLEMVEKKKPAYQARVDYLRAVERTHARDYDGAATTLKLLLNPETPGYHAGVRKRVLFEAWNLALTWHPEITKRVGWHELELPGRRVEAIAAVERRLAAEPQDSTAQELRTTLYSQLTEREFVDAAAGALPTDFNYDYVEQLGLALVDEADPDRRERGMGYLHIAGRGLPARGPGIFKKLADLYEKLGETDDARRSLETAKKCGQAVGPANLDRDQRDIYFASLKRLADLAEARGDVEAAIENLRLYLEGGGRSELETYRKLAELYAKGQGAVPNAILNAVLMVETGLTYNSTDADLLKKKDSYYYSVDPEQLRANREKVERFFDVAYCVRKAMGILNSKSEDLDLLDWATHLAKLAAIVQPSSNGVRLVTARCLLRRGDRDAGISMLEDVRESKKGSGDEEDAWYAATKILGQLYLDELNRPDLAVKAFGDYREYGKSGADTLYQLGRAYEGLGDTANAVKFYTAVTAYEEHPRYWDAKEALRRLGKE